MTMRATPHGEFGAQLDLRALLKDAQARLVRKETLQRRAPTTATHHVRIVDIHINEADTHAVILFRLIDKDAPDSVYEDFDSGDLEAHRKSPGQGNRLTAHLAIALNGTAIGDNQRFSAVLEVVSGISRGLIEQRMTSVGHRCGAMSGSLDGGVTDVEFSPAFTVTQFVERTIRQELTDGVLNAFTLVHKEPRDAGFDADRLVKQENRKIELKVVAADARTQLTDIVQAVQRKAQADGYELIKAHYDTPEGRSASADIDANRQDALEQMVGKITRVTLDEDVHPDQVAVTPCVCEKLIALLP